MSRDDVVRIDSLKISHRFSNVVVCKGRDQVHSADDSVDFLNAGSDLRLLHGVDDTTMTTRSDDHQAPASNQKICPDFMLEVIRNEGARLSFRRQPVWEAAKPVDDASLHLARYSGFSKLLNAMGPLVKP
jgi:hypothetical protein